MLQCASLLFSFGFAFDDYDFVQVYEVSFDLFLRFSFLSSSAEAFALDHNLTSPVFFLLHILSSRSSAPQETTEQANTQSDTIGYAALSCFPEISRFHSVTIKFNCGSPLWLTALYRLTGHDYSCSLFQLRLLDRR